MEVVVPHYVFDLNENETIRAIYKDGIKIETGAHLEMPVSIVQTYFRSARHNLAHMEVDADRAEKRHYGLQSFLMSLVGLEAFVNIYFHIVGRQKGLPKVVELANKSKVPIEHKLSHLPRHAFGEHLPAQKRLNMKVRELYNLRSDIVHPKWQPSSLRMPGLVIEDLVDNYQQLFEDREFCRESLRWCLLIIARIGIAAQTPLGERFVLHWTTLADTNSTLSEALGVPADGP